MTTIALPSYEDAVSRYEPVIGLEIHAQLATKAKIFSGASRTWAGSLTTSVAGCTRSRRCVAVM